MVLLYGAFATHAVTALVALYKRKSLRMPLWEALQMGLGLLIVPLLAAHVMATRGLAQVFDVEHLYARMALIIWDSDMTVIKQTVLLLIVWGHFVVGMHFWLRVYEWYRRYGAALRLLAWSLPLLGLLGFARAGQEVAELARSQGAIRKLLDGFGHPLGELVRFINFYDERITNVFLATVVVVLVVRQLSFWWRSRRAAFELVMPDGRRIPGAVGATMLEALRAEQIPHASVCGGRGRCTTCRVRIGAGSEGVAAPSTLERNALERVGAPPNVRLACQCRAHGSVAITPMLSADAGAAQARQPGGVSGREQVVTALFLDLRGSTGLGEKRLPYDVLFILNQFFAEMAAALTASHGHYAQFAGDGLMALYGLEGEPADGARQAVAGAAVMLVRLEKLNERLVDELDEPLRIGIGIHSGEAIVGTMGPPSSPNYSAIGDNINIAARLEAKTKELGCQVIVSAACLDIAGFDPSAYANRAVDVRGRAGDIVVCTFTDASGLPTVETVAS
jgi:adenylate cyclase